VGIRRTGGTPMLVAILVVVILALIAVFMAQKVSGRR
jgi:hypothetical protein